MKLLVCTLLSVLLLGFAKAEDDLALPKQCEDVLSAEQCQKLRDFATKVQEKTADLQASINAAVQDGLTQAKEIYERVRASLVAKLQAKTCEDLLPSEYCTKLRDLAATLKLKASEVDERIRELVAQGKVKASEIYQQMKKKYNEILAIRTCEDVLSAEQCAKIRNAAASVKAKAAEVDQAIREAVARGRAKAEEIYREALDFFRTRVLSKTCEDVMSADACAKLRNLATNMKEKAALVDEYVRRALLEGKTEAAKVLKRVEEYFQSLANAKTCDDVLPGETCDKLRELAEKLRLGADKASQAVRDAFQKGYTKVTSVTATAIENVKNFAKNAKCEDIMPADACANLREAAKKVKVSAAKVNEAVKDAVAKSIFFGKDVYQRAMEYLQENISCEKILGANTCTKIRKLATSVGVALEEADRVIKEKIMQGMDRLSEVYAAVLRFFQDKVWSKLKEWVPSLGKRSLEKRGIADWVEKAKAKAQEALEKAKELLAKAKAEALKGLKDAKVKAREMIAEAIRRGKEKLSELETIVKEIMEKYGPSGDELKMVKRDFVEDLREAAKKAKETLKSLIDQALAKGGDALAKLRTLLQETIAKIMPDQQKRELEGDIKIMTNILAEVTKRETEAMAAQSVASSEALLDEAFDELEDLADDIDDHSYSKKREVESDLFMRLSESLNSLAANL